MHEKMEKVLSIFKKVDPNEECYYMFTDTNDFQMFDYLDFVCVSMDDENFKRNKVSLSFYSSCPPDMSANIIRLLTKNKFNSFIINSFN